MLKNQIFFSKYLNTVLVMECLWGGSWCFLRLSRSFAPLNLDMLKVKLDGFSGKPGYVKGKAGAVCVARAFIPGYVKGKAGTV